MGHLEQGKAARHSDTAPSEKDGAGPATRPPQASVDDLRKDFAARTVDQLRAEVARILAFTAESIRRLSFVVAELERRGEDLAGLDVAILPLLRMVAAETLLPEIVVKYAGQVGLILRASRLAIDDQRRVLTGDLDLSAARRTPKVPPAPVPEVAESRPSEAARPRVETAPRHSVPRDLPPPRTLYPDASPRDVGESVAAMLLGCSDPKSALAVVVDHFAERGVIGPDLAAELRRPVKALEPRQREEDRGRGIINGVVLAEHERSVCHIAIGLGADARSVRDSWQFAEGYMGMMRAAEKFDPSRGVKFLTFATYHIRARILGKFREQRAACRGGGVHRDVLFTDIGGDEDGEWFGNTIAAACLEGGGD
jgi:hypothetical protein